jgi:uncharacterized protein YdhG (YjbR/CyaY superfamily)
LTAAVRRTKNPAEGKRKMRPKFQSVDDYIGAQAEAARAVLVQVRGAIRAAVPGAEETISYNIPAYRLHDGMVIYFAAWKKHFSLYPASPRLVTFFGKDLTEATIGTSTIRFPLAEPVPVELIGRVATFRVKELAERARAKK